MAHPRRKCSGVVRPIRGRSPRRGRAREALVPNSHKSVDIALPADLPRKFVIRAYDSPVAGETNIGNNQQIWRIVIAH